MERAFWSTPRHPSDSRDMKEYVWADASAVSPSSALLPLVWGGCPYSNRLQKKENQEKTKEQKTGTLILTSLLQDLDRLCPFDWIAQGQLRRTQVAGFIAHCQDPTGGSHIVVTRAGRIRCAPLSGHVL